MEKVDLDIEGRGFWIRDVLDAPITRVWKVWTEPEQIAQWWGPEGFSNTIHTMEVVAGGEWRLTMHGPDGKNYPNRSEFVEVAPLKKLVFQHFNPHYLATVVFEPQGEKTGMEWRMVFETTELFETVVKVFKADEGLGQNVGKLKDYLRQTKHLA